MGDNGNGYKPIEIDVTNDQAFKTGVVKYLQLVVDNTRDLPSVKKKVDKHERIVHTGAILGIPILWMLHAAFKAVLAKLGW